jgi:TolB protein
MAYTLAIATDATIEVIKKAETLPSIAVEDASVSYDANFKLRFFKALVADLNVISIFNVDRHYGVSDYDKESVLLQNKDMDYILRYSLEEMDANALGVRIKLLNKEGEELFSKNYRVNKTNIYMFVAHAIAYDINEYMGESPVSWIKRKVIFSKLTAPMKSEIVIADYTLTYQHTIVKGGLNVFPKWANKEQTAFYYTALATQKPTLKYIDIRKGSAKSIVSSDGMMICSDVSGDGKKLLLTMAPKGQPDIYLYDLEKKKYTKETSFRGIDVNGQFMTQDKIVFISSRLGYPNVFSKTLGSSDVEQMVYYGRSNSACSAHGKYVVYKARETSNAFSENTFNLHLISADTDVIRRLTATGVNEFPRFSRDGDAILFIKNYKGQSAIGIIRLNHNKNYLFPIKHGRVQSLDW